MCFRRLEVLKKNLAEQRHVIWLHCEIGFISVAEVAQSSFLIENKNKKNMPLGFFPQYPP